MRRLVALLSICTLPAADVTIRRDTYGIPHILAATEEGASFGLGYAQAEDHAEVIARHYASARGEWNKALGGSKENDFRILGYRNPIESQRLYRPFQRPTGGSLTHSQRASINTYPSTKRS